jgi:hypothetical protein
MVASVHMRRHTHTWTSWTHLEAIGGSYVERSRIIAVARTYRFTLTAQRVCVSKCEHHVGVTIIEIRSSPSYTRAT